MEVERERRRRERGRALRRVVDFGLCRSLIYATPPHAFSARHPWLRKISLSRPRKDRLGLRLRRICGFYAHRFTFSFVGSECGFQTLPGSLCFIRFSCHEEWRTDYHGCSLSPWTYASFQYTTRSYQCEMRVSCRVNIPIPFTDA